MIGLRVVDAKYVGRLIGEVGLGNVTVKAPGAIRVHRQRDVSPMTRSIGSVWELPDPLTGLAGDKRVESGLGGITGDNLKLSLLGGRTVGIKGLLASTQVDGCAHRTGFDHRHGGGVG